MSKQKQNINSKRAMIVVSDLHVNNLKAICPPVVRLDNGGTYHASPTQRKIWDAWLDFWSYANEITVGQGYDPVVVLNGDLGELDINRRTYELITPNKADILNMAVDVIVKGLEQIEVPQVPVYVIRGTPAHTGKSAWLEEAIADDIGSVPADGGALSHWHLRAKMAQTYVDVTHHGNLSSIPYRANASADKLAFETWLHYTTQGAPAPNAVIRSHMHQRAEGDFEQTRVYFTPSWSSKTDFVYRIGRENSYSSVGGLVLLVDGDKHQAVYKEYDLELLKKGSSAWTKI